jgi:hypothetical protein
MRKLKLELEQLHVDSFAVTSDAAHARTVFAASEDLQQDYGGGGCRFDNTDSCGGGYTTDQMSTGCYGTVAPVMTCGFTCAGTCYNTCARSCLGSCQTCTICA